MTSPTTRSAPSTSGSAVVATRGSHLATLTAIRFFAAAWVVAFHLWMLDPRAFPAALRSIASLGASGVSLFFVLSGFILAYTYEDRFASGRFSHREFFVARVARVYTLYLISIGLGVAQKLIWPDPLSSDLTAHPIPTVAAHLLLIQNWRWPWVHAINEPSWSIACEAAFYLLFPLFATHLRRLRAETVFPAIVALFGAGLVFSALYTGSVMAALHPAGIGSPRAEDDLILLTHHLPFVRIEDFVLGILVFHLSRTGLRRMDRRTLGIAFAFTSAAVLAVVGIRVLSPNWVLAPKASFLGGFPFAVVIYALARAGGTRPRWLGSPWLVRAGQASFALYLFHEPLIQAGAAMGGVRGAFAGAFAALGLAFLAYRWIEEPVRRSILGLSRRWERRAAEAVE